MTVCRNKPRHHPAPLSVPHRRSLQRRGRIARSHRHQQSVITNHQITMEGRTLIRRHREDVSVTNHQFCRRLCDPARCATGEQQRENNGKSSETAQCVFVRHTLSYPVPAAKTRTFADECRGNSKSAVPYGFVARIKGEGPGASSNRASVKPASSNQPRISPNEKVSPSSVFTSMFAAKRSGITGPVRSSFTRNSAMAIVPPGASASNTLRNKLLLLASPSLCRMWPNVATLCPLPKSA